MAKRRITLNRTRRDLCGAELGRADEIDDGIGCIHQFVVALQIVFGHAAPCGDGRLQRPSMGSWITYGLGSENQNLPGFVAMCPGGYPIVATQNWRSAFLPGAYQGTYIDTKHAEIEKLIENIRNDTATSLEQRHQLDLVRALNERHAASRTHDPALEARARALSAELRCLVCQNQSIDDSDAPLAKDIRVLIRERISKGESTR